MKNKTVTIEGQNSDKQKVASALCNVACLDSFTAGPWVVDDGMVTPDVMRRNLGDDTDWVAVGIEDEDGFAEVVAYTHPANARVIAAVPDLLRKLREILFKDSRLLGDSNPSLESARETMNTPSPSAVEAESPEVDLPRLVREFCKKQKWAAQSWKDQPHIKPLFDFANDKDLPNASSTHVTDRTPNQYL